MNNINFLLKRTLVANRCNNLNQQFIRKTILSLIFLVFTGIVIFNTSVKAQDNTSGSFSGIVYDENDKGLANVTITFTNTETGVPISTRTDENGRYIRTALPPGSYNVKASIEGYLFKEQNGLLLATKDNAIVPAFHLEKQVDVTVITQSTPSSSGGSNPKPTPTATPFNTEELNLDYRRSEAFTKNEITTIPLGSTTLVRSFDELAFLVPGVAPPPQAIGNSIGPGVGPGVGTSGQFSVNGLRSRANNFMIDGSDNNDEDIGVRRQGFFSLTPQPIESVQEFTIITLLAPAQFGRNMGAQVNVLSRSGSNVFHGAIYAFFNSERLNAREKFDIVGENTKIALVGRRLDNSEVPVKIKLSNDGPKEQVFVENSAGNKDPLTFLEGGITLGGPIMQNKMFFFVAAEGQLLNASKETHFAVPTVEERGFLGTGAQGISFLDALGQRRRSYPAATTGSFLLGLFPFPNDPKGLYGNNTYTRTLPASARGRVLSGRYDYNFNVEDKRQFLTARYNNTDDWRDLQQVGGAVYSSIRPLTRTDNFSAFLSGEVKNNLSNVLRVSWGRTRLKYEENSYSEQYLPQTTRNLKSNESSFLLNGLGLSNTTIPASNGLLPNEVIYTVASTPVPPFPQVTTEQLLGPIGQLNISGFSPVGVDVLNFPQKRINNTYQIADTMFLKSGNNNTAFGTDIRRTFLASDLPRNSRLSITSTGAFRGSAYNQGNDPSRLPSCSTTLPSNTLCVPRLISPIDLIAAGNTTGTFQSLVLPGNDASINLSFNQLNFFAQDDYSFNTKLKISFGLRYELNTVPREADRKIENSFQAILPTSNGLSKFIDGRNQIYDLDSNNFAPRIGFAYAPNETTVIRGGYGIYYDQILGAVVSQSRNVLPTFATVNFGGVQLTGPDITGGTTIRTPFNSMLIQPGTLNTLTSTMNQQQLSDFILGLGIPNPYGATIPLRKLDTPFSHQYSIGVEREIFKKSSTIISIAYVGTTGINLLRFTTPNLGRNNIEYIDDVALTGLEPSFSFVNCAPTLSTTSNGMNCPASSRVVPNIGPIDQFETTGHSQYNSLQLQARGRINTSFQYQVSYTLGNAKDDVSDVFDLAGSSALPQNSISFKDEYADANFDVRHRFTYNFVYELPELNNRGRLLQYVLGGWEIAGTGKFNTGQPFTVNTIYDVNQDGNPTDRLNNKDFIKVTNSRRQPLTLTTKDSNSLASMLAPIGQDGSIPRNSFRAGNVLELDMSFNKRFFIREGQNLALRFDVFNFINRANYGIPVRFLEAKNFGQAVDTITPGRRIQIALKYIF